MLPIHQRLSISKKKNTLFVYSTTWAESWGVWQIINLFSYVHFFHIDGLTRSQSNRVQIGLKLKKIRSYCQSMYSFTKFSENDTYCLNREMWMKQNLYNFLVWIIAMQMTRLTRPCPDLSLVNHLRYCLWLNYVMKNPKTFAIVSRKLRK